MFAVDTVIVAEVPDARVRSDPSPVIRYVNVLVPVKLRERLVLFPLQMVPPPLIVALRTYMVIDSS